MMMNTRRHSVVAEFREWGRKENNRTKHHPNSGIRQQYNNVDDGADNHHINKAGIFRILLLNMFASTVRCFHV